MRLRSSALITVLAAFLMSGCASTPNGTLPLTIPFQPPGQQFFHKIVPGETLAGISRTYHIAPDLLMRVNGIADPNHIIAGRRLMIPGKRYEPVEPFPTPRGFAGRWKYIIIHHSGTTQGSAESFDRSHRERGFWNGLGYHFLICNGTLGTQDGQIQVGDRWVKQIRGAHCNVANMNEVGIGICLVGDFEHGQYVSRRQYDSLVKLVEKLEATYDIPPGRVLRHSDVKQATACPGDGFPWQSFKRELAGHTSPVPRKDFLPMPGALFADNRDPKTSSSGRQYPAYS